MKPVQDLGDALEITDARCEQIAPHDEAAFARLGSAIRPDGARLVPDALPRRRERHTVAPSVQ